MRQRFTVVRGGTHKNALPNAEKWPWTYGLR